MNLDHSPASERNKQPILEALERVFKTHGILTGSVLEIGSGTGQHVVHFAAKLRSLFWQPSDRIQNYPGLGARLAVEGTENIFNPAVLDVLEPWPELPLSSESGLCGGAEFDAAYSANTAHIMGWPAVCEMFRGVGRSLRAGGLFCLYGPFNEKGQYTSDSNAVFDAQLQSGNPEMGLRNIEAIETMAGEYSMILVDRIKMPANNQLLVFQRNPHESGGDGERV